MPISKCYAVSQNKAQKNSDGFKFIAVLMLFSSGLLFKAGPNAVTQAMGSPVTTGYNTAYGH